MFRFSHCIIIVFFLLFISCKEDKFSVPQNTSSKDLTFATAKTIAQLRAAMGLSGFKNIEENIVISGFVIANDRTGNFYKQIIIDDGTAAIPILLDAFNLYNDFPIGAKVYLKCKGLSTNYYYSSPHICFTVDNKGTSASIPFHLWSQFLWKGEETKLIAPIEVSLADATKAKQELLNRLVSINDAQIRDTTITTWALDPDLSSASNIQFMDCDSNLISVRTSGFANFRNHTPPKGRGSITAIYSVFNSTPQLVLLDSFSFYLKGPRCF